MSEPVAAPGSDQPHGTEPDQAWEDLSPSAILVVDDEASVRQVVGRCLERAEYRTLSAGTLAEARQALQREDIVVVLSDITLAHGESGLELLAEVRRDHPEVLVILMTAHSDERFAVEAVQRGAYDYLTKPFSIQTLVAAVQRAVAHNQFAERALFKEQVEAFLDSEESHLEQVLVSMCNVIDAKSPFTAQHSQRVSALARRLAEGLGLDRERCDLIALGGRLHDIGKLGTPDGILHKPGALTTAEYEIIKEHPALGDDLLKPIKALDRIRPMVRWHHEALDGRGYPDGLAGGEVPLEAWVVKTADYWEAITSRRPYRKPMSLELAVQCLRGEAGVRIPEEIVETFLEVIQGYPLALPPLHQRELRPAAPRQRTTPLRPDLHLDEEAPPEPHEEGFDGEEEDDLQAGAMAAGSD